MQESASASTGLPSTHQGLSLDMTAGFTALTQRSVTKSMLIVFFKILGVCALRARLSLRNSTITSRSSLWCSGSPQQLFLIIIFNVGPGSTFHAEMMSQHCCDAIVLWHGYHHPTRQPLTPITLILTPTLSPFFGFFPQCTLTVFFSTLQNSDIIMTWLVTLNFDQHSSGTPFHNMTTLWSQLATFNAMWNQSNVVNSGQ